MMDNIISDHWRLFKKLYPWLNYKFSQTRVSVLQPGSVERNLQFRLKNFLNNLIMDGQTNN